MKSKKFFAKALAFAMVMGTVGVHGMAAGSVEIAQAADPDVPEITFDPVTYEATIEVKSTPQVGYVCLKVLKENKADAKVVSEAWYPVDATNKKAVVDLSFLKAGKEQYIMAVDMQGGVSTVMTIKAQPKTAIKYDAKTQKFVDKSKAAIADTDLAGYDYKTLYSSTWVTTTTGSNATNGLKTFQDTKSSSAAIAGTTLVIRKAADATNMVPAGTEVKVKIPAIAKAPKVKVDYVKGNITLPKNAEVVLVDATNGTLKATNSVVDWTKAEGKLTSDKLLEKLGVATAADVKKNMISGYTFAVRTAKVEGKKAASNFAFVTINGAPVIKVGTLGSDHTQKVQTDEQTAVDLITCTMLPDEGGMKLTPASAAKGYAYSTDGRKWTPITGEVTVKLEDKASIKICAPAVKGDDTTPASFASNVVEVQYVSYTTSN